METRSQILHQIDRMETDLRRLRDLVQHSDQQMWLAINRPVRDMHDVMSAVADHYGLTGSDLQDRCRTKQVSWARQVACWTIRQAFPSASLDDIGRVLHRDHSTVAWSIRQVDARMETEPQYAAEIGAIQAALQELA